jgi:hypothetical protein
MRARCPRTAKEQTERKIDIMKRKLIIGLLALGTILGFALGFARVCGRHHHGWHRQRFEQRVAEVCTQAALKAQADRPKARAEQP